MTILTPRQKNWSPFPEQDAVKIFAQALAEKLFDYTIDSYKAKALNINTSLYEATAVAHGIKDGKILPGKIIPIIEELADNLKNDPALLPKDREVFKVYIERLQAEKNKIKEFINTAAAFRIVIDEIYWKRILDKIVEATKNDKNNRDIIALADVFISEAELRGYDRQYVYYLTKKLFWSRPVISSHEIISNFLDQFSGEPKKFRYIFKVTDSFKNCKEFEKSLPLKMLTESEEFRFTHAYAVDFMELNSTYPLLLITNEIKTMDSVSGRRIAEKHIQTIANIFSFHIHQDKFQWMPVALCINENNEFDGMLKAPEIPLKKCTHSNIEEENENVKNMVEVLKGIHFTHSQISTFHKALDYHRAALESTTPENQLIDLWAALEGFLPPPDAQTEKITHFVGALSPCLTLTYVEKLFKYLSLCLGNFDNKVTKFIVNLDKGSTFFDNVCKLIVSNDFSAERDELYVLTSRSPLLRNRCFVMNEQFHSGKKTAEILEIHKRRIDWHIQRIYLTRNQIVHDAQSLPYLETLVENLHAYVDTLIRSITTVGVNAPRATTIDGAIKNISISEQIYLRSLKSHDQDFTNSDYSTILFGHVNPLSPYSQGM